MLLFSRLVNNMAAKINITMFFHACFVIFSNPIDLFQNRCVYALAFLLISYVITVMIGYSLSAPAISLTADASGRLLH